MDGPHSLSPSQRNAGNDDNRAGVTLTNLPWKEPHNFSHHKENVGLALCMKREHEITPLRMQRFDMDYGESKETNSNWEDFSTSSDNASPLGSDRKSFTLVVDGRQLRDIHKLQTPVGVHRKGRVEVQVVNEDADPHVGEIVDWMNTSTPVSGEVYSPVNEGCRKFVRELLNPAGPYHCHALLTKTQQSHFFVLSFACVFFIVCFFTCSSRLEDPAEDRSTLSEIGMCFLLPAYIAMLTSYLCCGNKIPTKALGIFALCFLFLLALTATCLIATDVNVPPPVWYGILILLGGSAGLHITVVYIMASLFPGGDSVRMINWGAGFAFFVPAVVELVYILLGEFIDWDPDLASRIKSAIIFGFAALFIVLAVGGLSALTEAEVFKLFRGRWTFSSQKANLDVREGRVVYWQDTWGFLGLQFLTAAITMYILVGANAVAEATLQIRPLPSFYDGFWQSYYVSLLVVVFLLGGFLGVCVVSLCHLKAMVDSTCTIISLFLPSFLRIGLVAAFYIYTQQPYLTSNSAFTLVLYLITGLSDVIIQHALESYCQKLCGYVPVKLISCKVGRVCLMARLLGGSMGVALSFIPI